MVLVDSSVIIGFLNQNEYREEITQLIVDEQIVTTDVIIMEVLQGIKEDKIYEKVKLFMDSIPIISAKYDEYILSANIYRTCRKKGKTIRKSIDCLIASIAINHGLTLFANDKDFRHITECFDLKLR
jgi:predicted nucleic acid-binding protein